VNIAYKVCLVIWSDATSYPGWSGEDAVEDVELALCATAGFKVFEDAEKIVLAATIKEDGEFGDLYVIPVCSVLSRKEL